MECLPMDKFYITGTRRGIGEALTDYFESIYECVDSLEECDIFINCKHDGFTQVEMLYKAAKLNKRIINIGSHASDILKSKYGVEKKALRDANAQLFRDGCDTTCINFGFIDTPRVADRDVKIMSVDYACKIIFWTLRQPHRVKEITICA